MINYSEYWLRQIGKQTEPRKTPRQVKEPVIRYKRKVIIKENNT